MTRHSIFGLASFVAIAVVSCPLFAQSDTGAIVDERKISLHVVHHFLDRSLANVPELANREDRPASVIQTGIEYCVNREVILQHLQSTDFKTSEQEIDRQIKELESQLERTGRSLAQFLKETQLTESELRRERLWRTCWRKYATKYVTVSHLEKQFNAKKKYFDGTKIHVGQILLKASPENQAETMAKAQQIFEQLESKQLPWSDAVKEHSESASAANDGDLGWIEYSGPMPRAFTQRAFELEEGTLSKPFSSKYGIHLVRCIEIVTGSRTFEEVAAELREIETNRLFQLVSKRQRAKAKIVIPPLKTRQ